MQSFRGRNHLLFIYLLMISITTLFSTGDGIASEYQLGVGDLLRISVWGHSELAVDSQVGPDGYITFPLVGDQYAAGKTSAELGKKIEHELENFIVEPRVTVMVIQHRKIRVQVLGEVRNPGIYTLGTNERVIDALGEAGGPSPLADLSNVMVTRSNPVQDKAEIISLNVEQYIQAGRMDQNPVLQDGDVIYLRATGKALVLGEVKVPGGHIVSQPMDVLDLLASAGGALPNADLNKATLTRREKSGVQVDYIIDLEDAMSKGKGNWQIQPDDVLFIPAKRQVVLFGEVKMPGTYNLNNEATLLDILGLAGGLTDRANPSQIGIVRDLDGIQEVLNIDASNATQGKVGGDNPRLAGGDVIYVPEGQSQVLVLGEVRNPGYHYLEYGNRVLDGIAKAGGLSESAAADEVSVTRQNNGTNEVFLIDLNKLMSNRFLDSNFPLQGGDVIIVPEANNDVLVLGEVNAPGMYTLRTADSLLDIIARAGGLKESSDSLITLNRRTGLDSEALTVDVNQLIQGNHLSNLKMVGGDVIYVPKVNRRVLVLGQVEHPGAYIIDEFTRLLDVIALAGGATTKALVDEIMVTNSAHSDQISYFDLNQIVANKQQNLMLQGGEVVFVPEAKEVLVMGEVVRPGSFIAPTGARILDLLALAGGTKNNHGAQDLVLTRTGTSGEQVWVTDFKTLMSTQEETNLLVQGGDVIFVPEVSRQVLVLGEVVRPGAYTISDEAKVLDAIALAGGPKERAALESIGIYRDGDVGVSTTLAMGKDKLLFQGDAKENPPITGGDIIYVPETNKPNWTEVFGFVGGVRAFQDMFGWFYNLFDK